MSPFPGFESLFYVTEGTSRHFRACLSVHYEDVVKYARGEVKPATAVTGKWRMGSKNPTPVIVTTHAIPLIISDEVRKALLPFSGWDTYDVEVLDKNGRPIIGYSGLAIKGRCGAVDNSKCVKRTRQLPTGPVSFYAGMYFDPSSWDGSDMFLAGENNWKFVTKSVKEALERADCRLGFYDLTSIPRSDMKC